MSGMCSVGREDAFLLAQATSAGNSVSISTKNRVAKVKEVAGARYHGEKIKREGPPYAFHCIAINVRALDKRAVR